MRFASAPIGLIVFNIIYKMDSNIGIEMSLIVVEAIRGRLCEFRESTCNGFGDIWWTDNPIYFSSIDVTSFTDNGLVCIPLCIDVP